MRTEEVLDVPQRAPDVLHLPLGDDPTRLTLFTGGGLGVSSGLGIQFAAVGYAAYRAAREAGVGRELPTEWFTETAKP